MALRRMTVGYMAHSSECNFYATKLTSFNFLFVQDLATLKISAELRCAANGQTSQQCDSLYGNQFAPTFTTKSYCEK